MQQQQEVVRTDKKLQEEQQHLPSYNFHENNSHAFADMIKMAAGQRQCQEDVFQDYDEENTDSSD